MMRLMVVADQSSDPVVSAFSLTQEQRDLQDVVRRIARERVASRAAEIDATAQYPQDMFELLKDAGLFGLAVPVEYGGAGSLMSGCLAVEELGRVCYNTAYLLLLQWTPISAIRIAGTEEQKHRFLPGLAAGELRAAFSLTESQSGSDVSGIKTTAVPDGQGGYRISGSKVWCSNAAVSDFILLAARNTGAPDQKEIQFFIVESASPGLEIGASESKVGARGIPSSPLYLDEVHVPAENVLGDSVGGFKTIMHALNASRPIIAARAVGLAQGAMDHAIDYIKTRHAFGQAIADFQGLRWMIADMASGVEAARLLMYKAASMVDAGVSGPELARAAAIAKCVSTDTAMKVATDAVQVFGASGISNDSPINRYMRDAKVLQIIEGTNQIQRNIIARQVIGGTKRSN